MNNILNYIYIGLGSIIVVIIGSLFISNKAKKKKIKKLDLQLTQANKQNNIYKANNNLANEINKNNQRLNDQEEETKEEIKKVKTDEEKVNIINNLTNIFNDKL